MVYHDGSFEDLLDGTLDGASEGLLDSALNNDGIFGG